MADSLTIADRRPVEQLVTAAAGDDQQAWNELVHRFAPLVWSICRSFRLSEAEAADVSQTVWLRTVERLGSIRIAAAFPGWLSTTTRRACLHLVGSRRRTVELLDESRWPETDRAHEEAEVDAAILAAEERAMVRECLTQLPEHCRRLLEALVRAENRPYAEVGAELGMPVGSIGPTRQRCLGKLQQCQGLRDWRGAGDDR